MTITLNKILIFLAGCGALVTSLAAAGVISGKAAGVAAAVVTAAGLFLAKSPVDHAAIQERAELAKDAKTRDS